MTKPQNGCKALLRQWFCRCDGIRPDRSDVRLDKVRSTLAKRFAAEIADRRNSGLANESSPASVKKPGCGLVGWDKLASSAGPPISVSEMALFIFWWACARSELVPPYGVVL